jgi:hypothetical protein
VRREELGGRGLAVARRQERDGNGEPEHEAKGRGHGLRDSFEEESDG